MDRRLLGVRGAYLKTPPELLTDPIAAELYHAQASRELAARVAPELANRLLRIAAEMELHAAFLEHRQNALDLWRAKLWNQRRGGEQQNPSWRGWVSGGI